jgi:hypothetical protein
VTDDPFNWIPPSPEGARHPAEMLEQFARGSAVLAFAFDQGNQELFDKALNTLQMIFSAAFDQAFGHGEGTDAA